MSTTTKDTSKLSKKPQSMMGADLVIEALIREGVEHVFAYPGGASMEMHQSLVKRKDDIQTILPRFEQGGGFMAAGYARASGKAGVCMATSGPGATNLVTCIADSYMDSVPLIAITGQVPQHLIGKSAFQETDIYGMTLSAVKHSYLVLDPKDIPKVIKEAFHLATTGRPGPVLIDIPKDVQQMTTVAEFPETIDLPGYNPIKLASDQELIEVLDLISESRQPVLYVGGGVISSNASEELYRFVKQTGIPITTTLMGVGAFPETEELSMKWFGMHGTVTGNYAVAESDLLLVFGARFDDRVTGNVRKFAEKAQIVHVDIDRSEHHKNKVVQYPIQSDIKYALTRFLELMNERGFKAPDLNDWHKQIATWKEQFPFSYVKSKHILAQEAVEVLYELTDGEAIITTGVGQHQMWAPQFYNFKHARSFLSSLGLGTMGFGYPAALGAKVAFPDREVIDIDGDGSFLMNIQELATAKVEDIRAKVMILNNQHLGMVVQWEDRFYKGIRAQTILGDPHNIGSPENMDAIYPNYVKIAEGFGVKARQIHRREDLKEAIKEMLDHDGPYLLDIIVPYDEHVLPMIPSGRTVADIILTPDQRDKLEKGSGL
ncbi:MAG: biosynthetic-type acetolactate synthase large subunit [Verrucomicrobia bacterium]|nr:biosynthetic-type acetolactate synthase large subunit [Verrucomicrobiota bacterium]